MYKRIKNFLKKLKEGKGPKKAKKKMAKKLKNLFKAAKKDRYFESAVKAIGEPVPSIFSGKLIKTIYAAMYCGWVLRGGANKEKLRYLHEKR